MYQGDFKHCFSSVCKQQCVYQAEQTQREAKNGRWEESMIFFINSKVVLANIFSNHLIMVLILGSVYQGGGRHSNSFGSIWFMDW